jgi:hypothetical protein
LFLLFLAACTTPEPNTAVAPQDEAAPQDDAAEPQADVNEETAVSPPSLTPAANVAEAAVLRDDDHTHGAVDPVVTIIEYGDFQ